MFTRRRKSKHGNNGHEIGRVNHTQNASGLNLYDPERSRRQYWNSKKVIDETETNTDDFENNTLQIPQTVQVRTQDIDTLTEQNIVNDPVDIICPKTMIFNSYHSFVLSFSVKLSYYLTGIPDIHQASISDFINSLIFGAIICLTWFDFFRSVYTIATIIKLCINYHIPSVLTMYIILSEVHNMFIYSMTWSLVDEIYELKKPNNVLDKKKDPLYYIINHITNDDLYIIHFGIPYPNTEINRQNIFHNMTIFNIVKIMSRTLGLIWLMNFNYMYLYIFAPVFIILTMYGYFIDIVLHIRAIGKIHINTPSGLDLEVVHD